MTIKIIISILIGYLFGCFETAYFIGKFYKGIDIREYGTSNAGASNVTSTLGWKYGILTALGDILKAVISVILISLIYNNELLSFLTGIFVIVGHIYPVFLNFRGGKGIASLIGMTLAFDFRIGLITILILVLITVIFDYIALGSILIYISFPVLLYFFNYSMTLVIISILLAFIGYYKHVSNIKKIISGNEIGLREVAKKKKFEV